MHTLIHRGGGKVECSCGAWRVNANETNPKMVALIAEWHARHTERAERIGLVPGCRIATWDEDDPLSHPFSASCNAEICSFCGMARSSHLDTEIFAYEAAA
jgi:alpha-D-ribose 1-methylphosphonate 5-phosphate C-P lyase